MPFYDYECKDCNYTFEDLVHNIDRDIQRCPMCNKHATRLLTARVAFVNKDADGVTRRRPVPGNKSNG
jgi:putative FmdB family regulatory protein